MAEWSKVFSIQQDTKNGKCNPTALDQQIRGSSIVTALEEVDTASDVLTVTFKAEPSAGDQTTLDTVVADHDGEPLPSSKALPVDIKGPSDFYNKAMVHETSCPLGYVTGWFGEGDDNADPTKAGGGIRLICNHAVSDSSPLTVVADLNVKENRSYIHEGFLDCLGAKNDYVHAEIIPAVTVGEIGSGTNFNNVNGVIIAAAGDGTFNITGVMKPVQVFTDPNTKIKPAAYWDFDYDEETHMFLNPEFRPAADGNYNLFASEDVPTIFPKRFWHSIPMLGNTSKWMQSADAIPIGCNMRIRCRFYTYGDDHAWSAAVTMVIHRVRLI